MRLSLHLSFIFLFSGSLFGFQLISFNGKPARWKDSSIAYSILSHSSQDLSKSGCDGFGSCVSDRSAIRAAFDSWQNISGINLSFEENVVKEIDPTGNRSDNSIVWVESGWTAQSFSPPSAALAVTVTTYRTSDNTMVQSDIFFNGEHFTWGVVDSAEEKNAGQVVDIQNIATHEIGHFIGLDHASEDIFEEVNDYYMATMYYASGPGETHRRTLHADDIAAARHLYGNQDYGTPEISRLSSNEFDIRASSKIRFVIEGDNFGSTTAVVLATSSGQEDITGKIIAQKEQSLEVEMDLYGLASGHYDLLLSNSYRSQEKLSEAIYVSSNYAVSSASDNEFSKASTNAGCSSNRKNGYHWTLLIFVTLQYLMLAACRKRAPVRVSSKARKALKKSEV